MVWECSHHDIIKLKKNANVVDKPTGLSLKLVRESEEVQRQIYINALLQKNVSLRSKRFRLVSGTGFSVLAAREMKQEPPPPRSFTYAIFRAVFDSRSSFFAPKPHGNACYAGLKKCITAWAQKLLTCDQVVLLQLGKCCDHTPYLTAKTTPYKMPQFLT